MVENAFVFVSDALRYDYLPESVKECGTAYKTVAASTITATSFASIFSGLHPPDHGMCTFNTKLDIDYSLLSLPDYDTSLWQIIDTSDHPYAGGKTDATSKHLEDMSPPFIHVERELATHAPYAGWDDQYIEDRKRGTAPNFFSKYLDDWDALRDQYQKGVNRSAERFQSRLEYLEKENLLEDTLVIFTSDHGELLGEYGQWDHTAPVVEELIYVPTVIIHPRKELDDETLFRHVDILPTIADVLDFEIPWNVRGTSVFGRTEPVENGYAEFHLPRTETPTSRNAPWLKRYEYVVRSIWDSEGGWAFNQSALTDKCKIAIDMSKKQFMNVRPTSFSDFKQYFECLYHHTRRVRRCGNPVMTKSAAREEVERLVSTKYSISAEDIDLSQDRVQQLRDLGYK